MAYGMELVFGWKFQDFRVLKQEIGIDLFGSEWEDDEEWENHYDRFNDALKKTDINDKLRAAHKAALEMAGFTDIVEFDHYHVAKTPLGKRKFAPFSLEMFYDPGEVHEDIEEAVVGVGISGRYVPTFVDWSAANGGLTNFYFDGEMNNLIKIARSCIEREIPGFQSATMMVVFKHY